MSGLAADCHVTPPGSGISLIAPEGTIVGVGNTSNAGGAGIAFMIGVKDGTVTVLTGTVLTGTVLTGIQGAGIGRGAENCGVGTGIGIDVVTGTGWAATGKVITEVGGPVVRIGGSEEYVGAAFVDWVYGSFNGGE